MGSYHEGSQFEKCDKPKGSKNIGSEKNLSKTNSKHKNTSKESKGAKESDLQIGNEGLSVISVNKRENNRIAAKKSRDRKKLYLELM